MLWRPGYQPIVKRNVPVPTLNAQALDGTTRETPSILVGGFSEHSLMEQDTWRRLAEDADLTAHLLQVVFGRSAEFLATLVPPSRRARTAVSAEGAAWAAIVEPDRPTRAFAALILDGVAEILVVGPPTEDVWEEFARLAGAALGHDRTG